MRRQKVVSLLALAVLLTPGHTAVATAIAQAGGQPVDGIAEQRIMLTQEASAERATPTDDRTRNDRLNKYKQTTGVKLTRVQTERLQARCSAAQAKLKQVEGNLSSIETNRERIYGQTLARMSKIATRLEGKGPASETYQQEVAAYRDLIMQFKSDFTEYKAHIGDAATVDCKADPQGFKAALETARTSRINLLKMTENIRQQSQTAVAALKAVKVDR